MSHLKRYSMPQSWPLGRKERVFVVSPRPGPHPRMRCIPLMIVVRDILKHAETGREARTILIAKKVLVDRKPRTDPSFPVGFMDVVEIPETKETYRVVFGEKGLRLDKISPAEADRKLCRIENKRTVAKGRVQLNLHDGRNIFVEKKNDYRPGDSILIQLPSQAVMKHYKLEKGASAMIISGKNIGTLGTVEDVNTRKSMLEASTIIMKSGGKEIKTLKEYVMPGEFSGMTNVSAPKAEPKEPKRTKAKKEKVETK